MSEQTAVLVNKAKAESHAESTHHLLWILMATVCIFFIAGIAVVCVVVWAPEDKQIIIITTIVGFSVTILGNIFALLSVKNLEVKVNGRLENLLATTSREKLAEGQIVGRAIEKAESEQRSAPTVPISEVPKKVEP